MAHDGGVDSIADELYALPLAEFTAARTDREKRARDAGHRGLAADIRALGKPNVAAWLVNQLARERHEELRALRELGAQLREATQTMDGDRLRDLTKQQHAAVQALVRHGRELAAVRGQSVSDSAVRGVQETLHAALVDEQAGDELMAGRLTDTLHRSGLGDWRGDVLGASTPTVVTAAKRTAPSKARPAPAKAKSDRQEDEAKRAAVKADQVIADARKVRDAALAEATSADETADAAHAEVVRLREELEQARAVSTAAEKRRRERAGTLRRAERALEEAERRKR